MTFRPMLAAAYTGKYPLRFPLLVSPKLDGVRCVVRDGVALSRSLKPIPNRYVQDLFRDYEGFDGELIVGPAYGEGVFNRTVSGVMSIEGEPDVAFWVFDALEKADLPFYQRLLSLSEWRRYRVPHVPHETVHTEEELLEAVQSAEAAGFEGLMARDPMGSYKHGRSTEKEGLLLKFKKFEDAEAEVIGAVELCRNDNEAKTNALGLTERGHSKKNKVPMGVLGTLVCRTPQGVEFEIGAGFTQDQRKEFWQLHLKNALTGRLAKYKHQPHGQKDKPRIPVFLGFRHPDDTQEEP